MIGYHSSGENLRSPLTHRLVRKRLRSWMMPSGKRPMYLQSAVTVGMLLATSAMLFAEPKVDFARDVQPILHARCSGCHGISQQQASLSVMTRAAIIKGGQSGPAVIPGEGDRSLLLLRIRGEGGPRMPLTGPALTAAEIDVIRNWIAQGAEWNATAQPAYRIAPVELRKPVVAGAEKNPLDALLKSYLRKQSMALPHSCPMQYLLAALTWTFGDCCPHRNRSPIS